MTKPTKTINIKIDAKLVRKLAFEIGFDDCKICNANPPIKDISFFENWIAINKNADMAYLEKNINIRKDTSLLVPNSKTIICVILNYNQKLDDKEFYISKYARGKDYHIVMKEKLASLETALKQEYSGLISRIFTDSAPILERAFASKAGLGFIGKNTCLIHPKFGSFTFIGEIICNIEANYDDSITDNCGTCELCVNACPVGALSSAGLDANKCISYHTIENKNEIPKYTAERITNQVFGCDICQDVCPYNQNIPLTKYEEFLESEPAKSLSINKLEALSNSQFKKQFVSSPLLRAGKRKLIANYKLVGEKGKSGE
ncbi:MAG: tRNA epoxyqueuosine(34) reductase QueG [Bacteroidales bacterium]|nr:tRNA epoxyqueuosine(34) reductase QueG [Bacteroidales bacterium]MDD4216452.1 tRNA epoxyqueuosine(34) reductase QueG [Bacteroidales bacterium]MDY0141260.1 tRNA epoxyqueuosine(34) reductase QueG [Bacteroidales bacterium]